MKSSLYHLQVNVDFAKNRDFYHKLMSALGFSEIHVSDTLAGYAGENGASIWFVDADSKTQSDYDNLGVNHISIRVENKADVDEMVKFLQAEKIASLFETPRHRPEFSMGEGQTYYQVMFESPDKMLYEVVYIGPMSM